MLEGQIVKNKPQNQKELRRLLEAVANKEAFFKLIRENEAEVTRRIAACKATAR